MRVPKYIQESIIASAKHRAMAKEENEKIRNWLDELGEGENDIILDQLIDSIEIGNSPHSFIEFLKKFKKSNFE